MVSSIIHPKEDGRTKFSITAVMYSVIVNARPVGFFSPQGDPLLPFLFISAMEGHNKGLEKARQMDLIQGFSVGSNSRITVEVTPVVY